MTVVRNRLGFANAARGMETPLINPNPQYHQGCVHRDRDGTDDDLLYFNPEANDNHRDEAGSSDLCKPCGQGLDPCPDQGGGH